MVASGEGLGRTLAAVRSEVSNPTGGLVFVAGTLTQDVPGIAEQVRFLGRLPIEEVAALYNAASAFVYPSLYEGFGLPPLEAMACGAPVITSNTSSLPEVVGEAAIQIDPLDVDALASAIHTVMTQPALAQTLREHGPRRAAQFSWRRCAQETARVYALQANSLV